MIAEYKMNVEKSREVFEDCSDFIEMKRCYNNVFDLIMRYHEKFKSGEWRIAYGYYTAVQNLMARHCFILTSEDEVIDPTVIATPTFDPDKEKSYVTFKVFGSVSDYMRALERNDNMPDLYGVFNDLEAKAHEWATSKQLILMG